MNAEPKPIPAKFLIISDAWHPQINGVVRTYEHLHEELTKLGHTVKIIGPSDFPLKLPLPGYAEIKLSIKPYARLSKIIKDYAPDYIHIAVEGPLGWAARKYCTLNNLEFSTSYHTQFPDYLAKRVSWFLPFLYGTFHNKGKEWVKRFHAPSKIMMVATQSLENELKEWGFQTPMHRMSRGVDTKVFYPGEQNLFQNLKRPVALYVGRIALEKNIEDFLMMPWQGSKVIVGEGPGLSSLRIKYPEAVFTGQKTGKALADHYRSSDLFIFPSKTDTFGIVILEALASGVPVAAYEVQGPKDILTESFMGCLTKDNLSEAAIKALECGSPKERVTYIQNHYTWKTMCKQFISGIGLAINKI